jgi:hypothetical protein
LLELIENIPPTEAEEQYYATLKRGRVAYINQPPANPARFSSSFSIDRDFLTRVRFGATVNNIFNKLRVQYVDPPSTLS